MYFSAFSGTIASERQALIFHWRRIWRRNGGTTMAHHPFLRGVGLGMLAGAVVGMVVSPGKEELKQTANKAVQAVGSAADTLSDAINQ
jgi:hypothetical protein